LTPILSHLARAKALTDEERKALRELIDGPDPESRAEGERS
jgi:hypothetical protein